MKLPAIMFYTKDWLEEPGLKLSSLAARGLWIDMLCFMSAAHPRGYLKINGKPMTDAELAILVRADVTEVTRLLKELDERNVYSVNNDKVIYSRRIVRDEKKRLTNVKNGKRGGNPALKKNSDPPLNLSVIPPDNRNTGSANAIGSSVTERGPGKTRKSRADEWAEKQGPIPEHLKGILQ